MEDSPLPEDNANSKHNPVYTAFFEQYDKSPPKVGKGSISSKYKALILFLFLLPYALFLLNIGWVKIPLIVYAFVITILTTMFISGFQKEMVYIINPFDIVWFQFINFINFVVHIAFAYYLIYLFDNNNFKEAVPSPLGIIDFLYYSVVTITTLGYGDIYPNSIYVKLTVIYELGFGLWFLVTIIPTAISLQSERLFQFSQSQRKLNDEILKGVKEGNLEVIVPFGDVEKKDEKQKGEKKDKP